MDLPEIEKGQPGWRKRENERRIMDAMARATTQQTGWDIFQKLRKEPGRHVGGDECCRLMLGLAESGHLKIVGADTDCGYKYAIEAPARTGETA